MTTSSVESAASAVSVPSGVALIAAVSLNGVIGVDGGIPWRYPADQKRFKHLTMGSPVIMGRRTWMSFPKRPLPGRRNLVITRRAPGANREALFSGAECFVSFSDALKSCRGQAWVIGGGRLYAEAMGVAEFIDLTIVPETIDLSAPDVVLFPPIDMDTFFEVESFVNEIDPRLTHMRYRRRQENV